MIDVRAATAADEAAVARIFRSASLSNEGDRDVLLAHPEALVLADGLLARGRTRVATSGDGTVVGFAGTRPTGPGVLELDDLFVDPGARRLGAARRLIQRIVAEAAEEGIDRIEVTANPHALGFYEAVGFVADGRAGTEFGSGLRMHLPVALRREGYVLEVEDLFDGDELDRDLWLPYYLPHWSSRAASAARYRLGDGVLRLLVEEDQPPWCPEFDGGVRVSSLQTGEFCGPLGSPVGQLRFNPAAVVREEQEPERLYTPQYGFVEVRARMDLDPSAMAAFWMIGVEDAPERSGEICVFEIFGRDVADGTARVGMGVHPWADPALTDDFAQVPLPIDVREFHTYAAEWTPDRVTFLVDDEVVRVVEQSPAYPMQFLLDVYAFPGDDGAPPPGPWPKELVVDSFRGWRPAAG
ncbi:GNAT family N-acetyltransferase [Petropleomorpha daqingensis]|uniref:Ribosomal protein S18 acetylase RimI-like enzyme n=1 Tax=Petropleomorpha daqingensis TaxID=2026353 RepID=A0A853CDG0_9ACTN|nr:GNAT family N-acetyltransferase [Petropleomorpha daqingensis]NYJ04183.1 ribosomal protein S18 acetylase RimI-like enzyme [Petropleomorpha daqingensis]